MSTAQLRRRVRELIAALTPQQLRSAVDYLEFLALRKKDEKDPADERERIPGLAEAMAKAEKDIKAGRVTDWQKTRRDV